MSYQKLLILVYVVMCSSLFAKDKFKFTDIDAKKLNNYQIRLLHKYMIDFYISVDELYAKKEAKQTSNFNFTLFNAYAANGDRCFFGGWPSVEWGGKCSSPWNQNVPGMPDNSYEACAEANTHRCNPTIFAVGAETPCVSVGRGYQDFTKNCKEVSEVNLEAIARDLANDGGQERIRAMLGQANEFCARWTEEKDSEYDGCSELQQRLEDLLQRLTAAEADEDENGCIAEPGSVAGCTDDPTQQQREQRRDPAQAVSGFSNAERIIRECTSAAEEGSRSEANLSIIDQAVNSCPRDSIMPAPDNGVLDSLDTAVTDAMERDFQVEMLDGAIKTMFDRLFTTVVENEIKLNPNFNIQNFRAAIEESGLDSGLEAHPVYGPMIRTSTAEAEALITAGDIQPLSNTSRDELVGQFNSMRDSINTACASFAERFNSLGEDAREAGVAQMQAELEQIIDTQVESSGSNSFRYVFGSRAYHQNVFEYDRQMANDCATGTTKSLIANEVNSNDLVSYANSASQTVLSEIGRLHQFARSIRDQDDLQSPEVASQIENSLNTLIQYRPDVFAELFLNLDEAAGTPEQEQENEVKQNWLARYICENSAALDALSQEDEAATLRGILNNGFDALNTFTSNRSAFISGDRSTSELLLGIDAGRASRGAALDGIASIGNSLLESLGLGGQAGDDEDEGPQILEPGEQRDDCPEPADIRFGVGPLQPVAGCTAVDGRTQRAATTGATTTGATRSVVIPDRVGTQAVRDRLTANNFASTGVGALPLNSPLRLFTMEISGTRTNVRIENYNSGVFTITSESETGEFVAPISFSLDSEVAIDQDALASLQLIRDEEPEPEPEPEQAVETQNPIQRLPGISQIIGDQSLRESLISGKFGGGRSEDQLLAFDSSRYIRYPQEEGYTSARILGLNSERGVLSLDVLREGQIEPVQINLSEPDPREITILNSISRDSTLMFPATTAELATNDSVIINETVRSTIASILSDDESVTSMDDSRFVQFNYRHSISDESSSIVQGMIREIDEDSITLVHFRDGSDTPIVRRITLGNYEYRNSDIRHYTDAEILNSIQPSEGAFESFRAYRFRSEAQPEDISTAELRITTNQAITELLTPENSDSIPNEFLRTNIDRFTEEQRGGTAPFHLSREVSTSSGPAVIEQANLQGVVLRGDFDGDGVIDPAPIRIDYSTVNEDHRAILDSIQALTE